MNLLSKIAWSFGSKNFKNIEDFNKEISQYQKDIMKDRACWNPEEIVIKSPNVDIQFEAWLKGPDDILENETLLEEEDFFEDEDNSDGEHFQAEILARFNADNGKYFTALELMYKLHKQMQSKELGDHVFFEGLSSYESDDDVPGFYLNCGS